MTPKLYARSSAPLRAAIAVSLSLLLCLAIATLVLSSGDTRPLPDASKEEFRESPRSTQLVDQNNQHRQEPPTSQDDSIPRQAGVGSSKLEPSREPEATHKAEMESLERKYEGMQAHEVERHYHLVCKKRELLARPILQEKMKSGLFTEFPATDDPGSFVVTDEIPGIRDNPMVLLTIDPLGDGRFVPRAVQLSPDETPEIRRVHDEAQWLKSRLLTLRSGSDQVGGGR